MLKLAAIGSTRVPARHQQQPDHYGHYWKATKALAMMAVKTAVPGAVAVAIRKRVAGVNAPERRSAAAVEATPALDERHRTVATVSGGCRGLHRLEHVFDRLRKGIQGEWLGKQTHAGTKPHFSARRVIGGVAGDEQHG